MARHGDVRSPSPVGSAYSASKRSRHGDHYDRSRRDETRGYRRSRSPDVRAQREGEKKSAEIARQRQYRDRDVHRLRERSSDRRAGDSYRSNRGSSKERDRDRRNDRDRDRRRSRERPDVRDARRRSRDRDNRERRSDSHENDRKRREGSTDSRRSAKRKDSRDRGAKGVNGSTSVQSSKPSTPAGPTDEEKKAERLAKLAAWKEKQKALEKKKEAQALLPTTPLLDDMDTTAAATPTTITSPQSPALRSTTASPAPYAGKFDPKAIAKKATISNAATTASKLGTDVAFPASLPPSAALSSTPTSLKANSSTASAKSSKAVKAHGNVSGFGLAAKALLEAEKPSTKRVLDLDEEEGSRKRLEKLPTPPLPSGFPNEDAMLANGSKAEEEDDDEDDIEMEDGTEEESAAAARVAAEKREERLQAQNFAYQTGADAEETPTAEAEADVDTQMTTQADAAQIGDQAEDEEEEIDELDAFMADLGDPLTAANPSNSLKIKKKPKQEPEAMFGDEDEVGLETLDADPDDILAMATKKKKKDMPTVNHAKVKYEPFRRDFYIEPAELAEMTEAEVADLRLELEGIKVRGADPPKPAVKWSQCGLGVQTMKVINNLGYEAPSAIQSQAIPAVMSGRDVIGVAKTGSGKTIAFLLPMFRHIMDQRPLDALDGPIGLIMTPTRELATQIHKECKPFLKALSLRAVCAYGGAPIKDQIADLKRGAEIIVCTPGRMIDLLAANSGRVTNLRRVTYIVLDEADRMFDMGFEPQVMKVLANIRPDRQTVLFSATFPRQMEALARKTLNRPIEIVVGGRSVVAPEITQIVEVRAEESKFLRLLELLGNLYAEAKNADDRALIFVDRQESADGLLRDLMRKGYPCMSIHGGKDQIDRDSTIEDFKAGVVPIMIATSVAARGLDVKQLKLVVNYDAPNHLEDYVHRAGRTGRAGNTGTAVTFLTPEQDRYALDIAKALRQSGQEVPVDVQKLVESFQEKVKSGKEKASGSGFGGKGLEKLDQERDAARNRERKTYKTGEEGEDDDKDDKEKKEKGEELILKAASTVQSASTPAQLPGVPKGIDLDGKITVHKTEPLVTTGSKLDRVSAAVASINNRLNTTGVMRQGVPIDNKGPDAGAFHATLEINDFPQKARWAVTNRTNVAKILEATGTSITTKGSFYPTGKEPGEGENPKLYILVEGDTEVVVTNAMRELMRLLKEGTIAAADSDSRAPVSGRYSVV